MASVPLTSMSSICLCVLGDDRPRWQVYPRLPGYVSCRPSRCWLLRPRTTSEVSQWNRGYKGCNWSGWTGGVRGEIGVGCKGVGLGWVARDIGEVGKNHRGNYGIIHFNSNNH